MATSAELMGQVRLWELAQNGPYSRRLSIFASCLNGGGTKALKVKARCYTLQIKQAAARLMELDLTIVPAAAALGAVL
jgi:hypothetical protein